MNELIVVKQLPIIEERLKSLSGEIEQQVNQAVSLVCTEDTVKTVKVARSELNKQFNELEEQRKMVKKAVTEPYAAFEKVYKRYVTEKFNAADTALKSKIDGVESEIKSAKAKEVEDYYNEHCAAGGIDFIPFERTGIKVNLSSSIKSLKEQAKAFVEGVVADYSMILTQEYADEILVEYKRSLNAAEAVTRVIERHRAMEAAATERAKHEQETVVLKQAAAKVETVLPPVQAEPEPELLRLTFTVVGTREKLGELKSFMDKGGYQYE